MREGGRKEEEWMRKDKIIGLTWYSGDKSWERKDEASKWRNREKETEVYMGEREKRIHALKMNIEGEKIMVYVTVKKCTTAKFRMLMMLCGKTPKASTKIKSRNKP